jgi:Lyase
LATEKTIPALKLLRDAVERKSKKWANVVKIGRTHPEDATPLTVSQEWSGYTGALDDAIAEAEHATHGLLKLAMEEWPSVRTARSRGRVSRPTRLERSRWLALGWTCPTPGTRVAARRRAPRAAGPAQASRSL